MEFRLTYNGRLKSQSSTNRQEKHDIRKVFHGQLRALWESREPLISTLPQIRASDPNAPFCLVEQVGPFAFIPLVSQKWFTVAEIDVLFLRREAPGQIIGHGGDIDNRIKTLFDALRVPTVGELPQGETPGEDQQPFYCLLQDDALVTAFSVRTDQLLEPGSSNDVQLVIHVDLKPTRAVWANAGL